MSVDNFIPQIWSAKILRAMKNSHVFGALATREYEGEIKQAGDVVKINQIGDITVSTYTKNSTSITPEELTDAQSLLKIDQSKYFAFKLDDVDKAQAKGNIFGEATDRAGYSLKDTADTYMAGLYTACGISRNTDASPVDMTSLNVEEEFLAVLEDLRSANAPADRLFAIIPPWVMSKLTLAGIANLTTNDDVYKNGFIGRALGFDFYLSNNVSKNSSSWDQTRIICGVKGTSFAYAEQVVSVEAFRPESSFSDAVKGLHLYGAKIIRPDVTAVLYADKTTEA